jgi:parallel beta helix pectate lyase-like protein/uncharacterized protein DUF1565
MGDLPDGVAMSVTRRLFLASGLGMLVAPTRHHRAFAQGTPTPTPKRTLFVDQDHGDDGNSGGQSDPFATISRACQVLEPGDRVEIAAGTYEEKIVIGATGTQDAPIVITAASGADVQVKKGGIRIAADYVSLESITVEDAGSGDDAGIYITRGQNIALRNMTARKNDGGGVKIKPADGPVVDLLISGGTFADNNGAGIVATGEDVLVGLQLENLTLTDNAGDGLQVERASQVTVSGISTERNGRDDERNGVFLKQVRGAEIGGVFSEDNGHNGIALRGAENILISRCISRGNSHHGFDSIEHGKKITYANNVSYANGSGDQDKGLYVTATAGITLQNNILFENAGDQLAFSNEGGDVTDIASDHNLMYRSDGNRLVRWFADYYSDLAAYQTASGQDAASLSADPHLTDPNGDNYTPMPDSPVIDAGTEVGLVTDGYSGKAPDIGAIEYRA